MSQCENLNEKDKVNEYESNHGKFKVCVKFESKEKGNWRKKCESKEIYEIRSVVDWWWERVESPEVY